MLMANPRNLEGADRHTSVGTFAAVIHGGPRGARRERHRPARLETYPERALLNVSLYLSSPGMPHPVTGQHDTIHRSPADVRTTAVLLFFIASLAGLYLAGPDGRAQVSDIFLLLAAADTDHVRDYLLGFGWWAPVVSTGLHVFTAIVAPLPSFMLALVNAMLYGLWWGALLTWLSGLIAGATCFAISRRCGRSAVERLVPRGALAAADSFFVRRGVHAVVIARVLPFINPDVVSYVAGLTKMRWPLFIGSVAVGSMPSTVLYSYLGSRGAASVGLLFLPLLFIGIVAFLAAMFHHYLVLVRPRSVPSAAEPAELG